LTTWPQPAWSYRGLKRRAGLRPAPPRPAIAVGLGRSGEVNAMNNDALGNKRVLLLSWINFGIALVVVIDAVLLLVLFLKP
jgi:hypothetical protein